MDTLLAEMTAETATGFPWPTGTRLTVIARHRLSDEEPGADEDPVDPAADDDDEDEDWDDEDLDDEDWDDDDLDDDEDWDDDDDDDDEPENAMTLTFEPAAARPS